MSVDAKKYMEELLEAAGVSDDNVKQAVSQVFSNEKASKKLADDLLRQQDYSRSMNELKAEKDKWTDWYGKASQEFAANAQLVEQTRREKAAYEAIYGPLGQQGQVVQQVQQQPDLSAFEKKMNEEFAKRDQQYVSLLKDGMKLTAQHYHEFREPLDTDALAQVAVDKKLTLRQAYDEMVGQRRLEAQQKAFAEKLAAAREEGARDFASKHKLPVDTQPREHHVLFDNTAQPVVTDYQKNTGTLSPQARNSLRESFINAYTEAGQTSK